MVCSGFHVFRDHPNHLSILIQASMDYRVERVARKQLVIAADGKTEEEIADIIMQYIG